MNVREYGKTERHMGTEVTVSIVVPATQADTIIAHTFDMIKQYEKIFSRFDAESELSQLNNCKDMVVSETFLTALEKARALYDMTEGIFNPLVSVAHYGYDKDYQMLVKEGDRIAKSTVPVAVDFSRVCIDTQTRRVQLGENQQLDFGGFLKGFLAEKLAKSIEIQNPACGGVIVNIGGDLHTRGFDEFGKPFVCTIFNPVTHEELPIVLHNTSLATSGTYARVWHTQGVSMHHILSPEGTPNPQMMGISGSVVHPDGAMAEALTKVLLLRGTEALRSLCGDTLCRYVLIQTDGTINTNNV